MTHHDYIRGGIFENVCAYQTEQCFSLVIYFTQLTFFFFIFKTNIFVFYNNVLKCPVLNVHYNSESDYEYFIKKEYNNYHSLE